MKLSNKFAQIMVAMTALLFAPVGFGAGAKTLIELDGGAPKAALAKSWKKVKDGEYTFELDTTAEIKKGVGVTPAAVKSSLESKLGTTHGVKVTPKGASGVDVTFTCKEPDFLEQISKTKIREGSVELALESSTSEGGIRAKPGDRPPTAGEVKGTVVGVTGDVVKVMVGESKADKIKGSTVVKVKAKGFKTNEWIFFQPDAKGAGDVWTIKNVLKQ